MRVGQAEIAGVCMIVAGGLLHLGFVQSLGVLVIIAALAVEMFTRFRNEEAY